MCFLLAVKKTMGTPLPPNEPGDLCNNCWGAGNPFGDGPTPMYIWVQLFDYKPGPLWDDSFSEFVNMPHLLPQKYYPCAWELIAGNFLIRWELYLGSTGAIMQQISPTAYFWVGGRVPRCLTEMVDPLPVSGQHAATGGTLKMWWDEEGL